MTGPSPVIATKILVPKRRLDLLHRPRLVDFIHEHIDRKLIVISAGAGYGKTSLLIDFAHDTDIPVCWYAIDRFDNDPHIFLEHLLATLQHRFPSFGKRFATALQNTGDVRPNLYSLVATLANEILEEIPEYFAILLDDYHFIDQNETINDFIGYLLRYIDENCHIIISSRTLPPIPDQALLVARNEMVGLSTEELKFTPQEIQALVKQNYDLSLPDEKAEELARHSEGWITGILLTAHSMWEELLEGVIEAPEASGRVYQYLAEQVFAQQPSEIRQFLLGSSVLAVMSPALCDQLLDIENSAQLLETLERKNLFITRLEDKETWFTYHHLFRDFLRDRLQREDKERYEALHLEAARIHKDREEFDKAVECYLTLNLHQEAARTIELAERPTYDAGRLDTLAKWIDAIPADLLLSRPHLISLRGKIYSERGELSTALELYDQALSEFVKRDDGTQIARTLYRKATVLRFQGNYQESI
ncbi:MAG: hypothetical protein ACE5NP_12235, partial [Anaerolineae bacterium]